MAVSFDQLISQAKEAMERSLQHLKDDLRKVRTGRANPSLLDSIRVDYYGTPTPLNQMANLSAPEPRLIVISPYDKSALQAIEKAIQASDLNLTPNNDGKIVRIPRRSPLPSASSSSPTRQRSSATSSSWTRRRSSSVARMASRSSCST